MKNYTLENIEWTQYWTEDAESGKSKVLMIGDSISAGYRSIVNELLDDSLSITAYSTSKAVDNPWFTSELELNVKQGGFNYSIVTLNNGLHGFHLNTAEYEKGMRRLISAVQAILPDAKLYLVLSTPITKYAERDKLDEKNQTVIERNNVVLRIADELNLPVIDLYSTVLGEAELREDDGYHYNHAGYKKIAAKIVEEISK